jgi:hypothetical protein
MLQVAGDVYPIKYTADSFFFLHTINAYEEKDQASIYYQQQSWVRSQHPPTQWNLRGGIVLNKVLFKKSKKSP